MTLEFKVFARGPQLEGERIMLRPPRSSDYAMWSCLRAESRTFLEPWEPSWSSDELTRSAFGRRLRQYRTERRTRTGLTFFILDRKSGALAGGISLANIRHGASCSAQLGYWMGSRHAGNGIMPEAVDLVVGHAFDTLLLHRIEAACIPGNTRSMRVLEKAGFQREGLLHSYLRIRGEWHDHVLYAKIRVDGPKGSRGG